MPTKPLNSSLRPRANLPHKPETATHAEPLPTATLTASKRSDSASARLGIRTIRTRPRSQQVATVTPTLSWTSSSAVVLATALLGKPATCKKLRCRTLSHCSRSSL
ncbi:hypothetical protein BCR44DRAFT_1432962, partial [Catenaria anguillulae PL171]